MGWRFTAVQKDLTPQSFWGLTRKSLKSVRVTETNNSEDSTLEYVNQNAQDISPEFSDDPEMSDDSEIY